MPLATPPYTYDDPRILYDEICFFYDGGYDSVCLATPTIVVGRSSSSTGKRKKEQLEKPFINIFIETKLLEVNGEVIKPDEPSIWYRFSGENDIVEIYIDNVKIDITKPMVEGKFLEAIRQIINYSGSLESKSTTLEEIFMSSSFYITDLKAANQEPVVILEKTLEEPSVDFKIVCEPIFSLSMGNEISENKEE